MQDSRRTVSARAPASLSNLGRGFDSLGVAISGMGDRVTVRRTRGSTTVTISGDQSRLPTDPRRNTASVAAMKVVELARADGGLDVRVEKGIPFGSGLGGSAASAAAGALAANVLLDRPLDEPGLIEATLTGEAIASGCRHGDNALPSLLGGMVLVDAVEPVRYRILRPTIELHFVVVVPDLQVETSIARRMLPHQVSLSAAVRNASSLAMMVEALHEGDIDLFGMMIMRDTIVEPVRCGLIPCYEVIRRAALEAGAPGCALSGSGPAIFAVCRSLQQSADVLGAMKAACSQAGFDCLSMTAEIDATGARLE